MRLSSFVVGLILVSLLISLITLVVAGYNEAYPQSTYDNSTLEAYNKLNNLTVQADGIRTEVAGIKQNRDALDVIGGFFSSGYNSIILTASSIDTFDEMANVAAQDSALGQVGFLIKTALVAIIIVLIFVGVIMSAIAKWPL